MIIGLAMGIGISIVFGLGLLWYTDRGGVRKDTAFDDMQELPEVVDSLHMYAPLGSDKLPGGTRLVDESVVPYMVDGLCGYAPTDNTIGVITVRKDMAPEIYRRVFFLQPDSCVADSANGIFLLVSPNRFFPDGECGRLLRVVSADSFYQAHFKRTVIQEAVGSIDRQMNELMQQIEKMQRQLQGSEN